MIKFIKKSMKKIKRKKKKISLNKTKKNYPEKIQIIIIKYLAKLNQ